MMRRALPLLLVLGACDNSSDGSGQASELRTVGEYESVRVEAPVHVRVGSDATLCPDQVGLDCEDIDRADLLTAREDGVLIVRYEGDDPEDDLRDCSILIYGGGDVSVEIVDQEGALKMTIAEDGDVHIGHVDADSLDIDLDGEGDLWIDSVDVQDASFRMSADNHLTIDELRADTVSSDTSGHAVVSIRGLDAGTWTLDATGGSAITAAGYADWLDIRARGNALVDAAEVKATDVTVDASGNAEVYVTALEEADIDAGGNATVAVGGDPDQSAIDVQGSASVTGL